MICQTCSSYRGLFPADPVIVWQLGVCDICLTPEALVASELEFVHHTPAEAPLDEGGADGINRDRDGIARD